MKSRIAVLYYSMYGNTYKLAEGVCEGVKASGGEPLLMSVPELLPGAAVEADENIRSAKKLQKEVRIARPEDLEDVDGVIMGSPTRFGNMCSQMRNFWDQTGGLWMKGTLINKPGGVFCCTATQHGGQETTLISMMFTLLHHGMLVVGVPYSLKELSETAGGGGPYGPSAVVGVNGNRPPTTTDLAIARELGKRVTMAAEKMASK